MIDVGFIDRVRGAIGIQDVLKGGIIKGEGFTGFMLSRSGSAGESGGVGSPVGVSVGMLVVRVCVMGDRIPVKKSI